MRVHARTTERDRTLDPRERELQGRYKGSNLPALNEPRLRTRILGAKLAYIADGARGLLRSERMRGWEREWERDGDGRKMSLQQEEADR